MLRRATTIAIVSLAATGLAACGGSSSSTPKSATGSPKAGGTVITIKNFKFSPVPLTVKAGSSVSIMNTDGAAHTFTADDKSFDSGNLAPSSTGMVTVSKAGTFAYHCSIHDYMKGTLTVEG